MTDFRAREGRVSGVPSGKLVGSKWTATAPRDREKHFVVRETVLEGGRIVRVALEAIHSGRILDLSLSDLRDAAVWRPGWH